MRLLVPALAAAGLLGGVLAGARGVRLVARGLRAAGEPDGALWLIRGLRGLIVCICLTCVALGVLFEQGWLLVFAGIWLLEEIYETGVLALILRAGAASDSARAR